MLSSQGQLAPPHRDTGEGGGDRSANEGGHDDGCGGKWDERRRAVCGKSVLPDFVPRIVSVGGFFGVAARTTRRTPISKLEASHWFLQFPTFKSHKGLMSIFYQISSLVIMTN